MHIAEVAFTFDGDSDENAALSEIYGWFSALHQNGQVLGREMPIARRDTVYSTWIMLPEADSLDSSRNNEWAKLAEERLVKAGLTQKTVRKLGQSPDAASPCRCDQRRSLILYTNCLCLESCVRCGDCFDPVPLYTLSPTHDNEFYDIICWQSDYGACDQLQLGCATGERFGLRQMSNLDSSLTQRGREICRKLEAAAGVPVYYSLYRYYKRSERLERGRRCPGCGGEWLLSEPLHRLFDFRCETCRLLSNIAYRAK